MELLSNPQILFLDEPTSGLDSYTSYIIIKLLRDLAKNGMMIAYTIHQPSTDIFRMFDNLLILNRGKISYFGKAESAYEYYEELGYPVPSGKNPIDFFIQVTIKADEKEIARMIEFHNKKKETYINRTIEENKGLPPINRKVKKPSFFRQFWLLFNRQIICFVRTPLTFKIRIIQVIFLTVFFILLFYRFEPVNP